MKHLIIILIGLVLFSCKATYKSAKGKSSSNLPTDSSAIKTNTVIMAPPPEPEKEVEVKTSSGQIKKKVIITESMIIIPESKPSSSPKPKKVLQPHRGAKNSGIANSVPEFNMGEIIYQIPDSMKIGKVSEVFVRISATKNSVNITSNVTGPVITNVIKVSETMEVELIDPTLESFKIVQNNKAKQIIENDSTFTEWRWDVTPAKAGFKSLKIVVSIIRGDETKQTVYMDSILVKSDPIYQTKGFFEKYWQWLMSTIVIPFVVWFWKRRKKDKEE
jgi:ribosomal protein S28E/S33